MCKKKYVFTFILLMILLNLTSCTKLEFNNVVFNKINSKSAMGINLSYKEYDTILKDKSFKNKSLVMNNSAYIHSEEIFEKFGYNISKDNNQYTFSKDSDKINIFVESNKIKRNDIYIFIDEDSLIYSEDTLYIKITTIEKLLTINYNIDAKEKQITLENFKDNPYGWDKYKIIAHAMGSVAGRSDTSSLEAFEYNYANGQRLFEVDLILTSDGYLVARHDWLPELYNRFLQNPPEENDGHALSLEEFKSQKIYRYYTPIDFYDIAVLMSKYKDVYLVTDTKFIEKEIVLEQFEQIVKVSTEIDAEILDRVIPQFYNYAMYYWIHEIYEFRSFILTVYAMPHDVANTSKFLKENNLKVITIPHERISTEYINEIKKVGAKAYTHTINDFTLIADYDRYGVHGYYSDYIMPDFYKLNKEG